MAKLFDSPFFTALDGAGKPISGATLSFFLAGTSTPTQTYSDRELTVPQGAVVTADSSGRFPAIWLTDNLSYRVIFKDALGNTLRDQDYAVEGVTTSAVAGAGADLKNVLFNGGFDAWSLGTSYSNISGSGALVEVADDWFFAQAGTASNSVSRQTAQSNAARYGIRFGRPNASIQTGALYLLQRLPTELAFRLRGKTVTLSFTAVQGANFSGPNLAISLATGTGIEEALSGIASGSWTGQAVPIVTVQGLTTTATRYQFTGTLDSNISEIGLQLSYVPSGTAGANDWVQIENVQIEVAASATDFAVRPSVWDFLVARATAATAAGLRAALGFLSALDNLWTASSVSAARAALGINVSDNRIINGRMEIDQRNAGAAVTVNSGASLQYAVDRWGAAGQAADGVFTVQRQAGGPPGFVNFLRAAVTTADASIGSSQSYFLAHNIEGTMVADLAFGTASAAAVTLRFWVRSSLTGAFSGSLSNASGARSYPFSFTINAANTWELKTVTIAGDTTGTWATDTGNGIQVNFDLGCGSTLRTTAGAWAAGNFKGVTSAVSLISTLSATLDLTGVELVRASSDLGPSWRSFQQELELCQRYYQILQAYSGRYVDATTFHYGTALPVVMRATPTVGILPGASVHEFEVAFRSVSSVSIGPSAAGGRMVVITAAATAGNSGNIEPAALSLSAEL